MVSVFVTDWMRVRSHSLMAFNFLLSWSAYYTFLKKRVGSSTVHRELRSTSRSIPSCNNTLGGCYHGRLSGEQRCLSLISDTPEKIITGESYTSKIQDCGSGSILQQHLDRR
jgi:hypothetical protein